MAAITSAYNSVIGGILGFLQNLINSVPEEQRVLVSLFLYTIFIVIYVIFIWKFYRFMAEKDIIQMNLSQYNLSKNPGLEKFYVVLLNILEYAIILPFLVLFWFTIFSIFLLILSNSQNTHQILLITSAIIASTRITAYINGGLSRDLAKIFPFTVLALFLLDPEFFSVDILFSKIIEIPQLFGNILIFLIFISGTEFLLRITYSVAAFVYSRKGEVSVSRL